MVWRPDYASLAEAKAYLRIPVADVVDDAEIQTALSAASRAIEQYANRQYGNVTAPVQRFYTACWDRFRSLWTIEVDDVYSTTGLAIAFDAAGDGTYATPVTAFVLELINAPADAKPWTGVRFPRANSAGITGAEDAVRVTALYGWAAAPVAVKQACLLQMSRLFKRRDAPFGVAGSPEIGSEIRLLNKLDPDVEVALRPYRRVWGAF